MVNISAQAQGTEVLEPPPLEYRKWGFNEGVYVGGNKPDIRDCVCVGVQVTCRFDHLETASICGGWGVQPRPSMPSSTLYITCGTSPFIGFYYAIEGQSNLILTEVAYAVASKLKSAISNTVR